MSHSWPARLAFLLAGLGLVACSPAPASRQHLPGVAGPAGFTQRGDPARLVFIDRVAVARYADRPQLVTRGTANRLGFEEFDVWAEPLSDLVTRALVDAIGQELGFGNVMVTPDRQDARPLARLTVQLLRFDGDAAGAMTLDARWTLLAGPGLELAATGRERITLPAADPASNDARIAALELAIGELARRLITELRS